MKASIFIGYTVLVAAMLTTGIHKSEAQTRTKTVPGIQIGTWADLGGTPALPADSLQVTDSISYIVPITHTGVIYPYASFVWNKIGAGTATVAATFYQSNDLLTWFPLLKGIAQSAYTKSYTLSASGTNEIDMKRDTVPIGAKYFRVTLITTSTASVKGKLAIRFKANQQ